MTDWVSIEEARKLGGLRLVLLRGVPSPWSLAARGIFEIKRIPFVRVYRAQEDPPGALLEWTRQDSFPAAMYEDERPRTGWAEILLLAERLAPEPRLIPEEPRDRAFLFGLSHEICGEMSLGWARRLLMMSPQSGVPALASGPFAQKYGSGPDEAKSATQRVVDVLNLLTDQLKQQRAAGREFLIGDTLTAIDIYWATFSNLIQPLPPEQLPMPDALRKGAFSMENAEIDSALDPILLKHRDAIWEQYLNLPVKL